MSKMTGTDFKARDSFGTDLKTNLSLRFLAWLHQKNNVRDRRTDFFKLFCTLSGATSFIDGCAILVIFTVYIDKTRCGFQYRIVFKKICPSVPNVKKMAWLQQEIQGQICF